MILNIQNSINYTFRFKLKGLYTLFFSNIPYLIIIYTLIVPISSELTTIGVFFIQIIEVTIFLCPSNLPILLNSYYYYFNF